MPSRTWLITGVSSGFGRELTQQLLAAGARVAALMPEYDGNPAHAFRRMLDSASGLAPGDPAPGE